MKIAYANPSQSDPGPGPESESGLRQMKAAYAFPGVGRGQRSDSAQGRKRRATARSARGSCTATSADMVAYLSMRVSANFPSGLRKINSSSRTNTTTAAATIAVLLRITYSFYKPSLRLVFGLRIMMKMKG